MHTAFFISSSIFLVSRALALLSSQARSIARAARGPVDRSDTAKSETDLMSDSDFYYN